MQVSSCISSFLVGQRIWLVEEEEEEREKNVDLLIKYFFFFDYKTNLLWLGQVWACFLLLLHTHTHTHTQCESDRHRQRERERKKQTEMLDEIDRRRVNRASALSHKCPSISVIMRRREQKTWLNLQLVSSHSIKKYQHFPLSLARSLSSRWAARWMFNQMYPCHTCKSSALDHGQKTVASI